jgi:hypothetical protein
MRTMAIAICVAFGCGNGGGNTVGGPGGPSGHDEMAILKMTPFPVDAGAEVYMCQTFANPFGGADAEVVKIQSNLSPGSHHMLLLFQDNATNGTLTPCSGLTFGPMAYETQAPQAEVTFPQGIAELIKSTQGFHVIAHYLNATNSPIMANVQVTMYKAQPGTITQHAGVFFLNNIGGLTLPFGGIPPMTTKTISASYTTSIPMNLLYGAGHMHSRTQSLVATNGGTKLYESDSWDQSPLQSWSPPIQLAAGAQIGWSCTVKNDTANWLTFGESAKTNEMCIFTGAYFPVPAGADPSILASK